MKSPLKAAREVLAEVRRPHPPQPYPDFGESLIQQLEQVVAYAQSLETGLTDAAAKLVNRTLHVTTCNANPAFLVGCDGCSCPLGRDIKRARALATAVGEAIEIVDDPEDWEQGLIQVDTLLREALFVYREDT